MRTSKVVLGTVAGLSVGAIVSILFAPEKGSTTRKQIMDKSRDYVGKLKTSFNESFDSLKDRFKSSKKDAEGLIDKGKGKLEDVKKDVKNASVNFKHDGALDSKHAKP